MAKNLEILKVTPINIRQEILKQYNQVKEITDNEVLLKVPKNIWGEVMELNCMLRNLITFENRYRISKNNTEDIKFRLSFYRGSFNKEVNGYNILEKIPKELFEEGKKLGLLFAIRFRSEFLNETINTEKKNIVFWYIREDV